MKLKSGLCAVAACMALAPALKAQDLLYLNEFPLSQVELLPGSVFRHACDPVSYTHLTLPTICSV